MTAKQPPPHQDPNTGPWIRKYLLALLADPSLQPAHGGLLSSWLEQQIDPAVERDQPTQLRVTLQHAVMRSQASVLLGPAGSGKSTLIRQHVRELAQDALDNEHAPLPLYVPLTFFAGSIEGTLAAQARMRGPSLATLALTRPCILIVDALNDLPPAEQMPVLGMLRRALSTLGPQSRWVIACRSEVWGLFDAWFPSGKFQVWRMRPWSDQTIISTAQRAGTPATDRLLRIPGAIELARRPRWFGSFLQLVHDALPGPLLAHWIKATAIEAARTHCLPDQYADIALPLLQEIAAALAQNPTLNRATIANIVADVAGNARLQAVDVHALLEALALLHPVGDDEWVFRAPILGDFDLALELEAVIARQKHQHTPVPELLGKANRTAALSLLYGLLPSPQPLLSTLIATGAWETTQQVLDANIGATDALTIIEQTIRSKPLLDPRSNDVNIDIVAALSRAWAHNGSPDVAIPLLEWTVWQGRDDPYLFGLLGNLQRQVGNWTEARNAYQEAVRRDPTNSNHQQALALVRKELGESDAATTSLESLLTIYNNQTATTAFQLGTMQEEKGLFNEALEQYTLAVTLSSRMSPDYGEYQLARARVLRELGRHDEAAHVLRNIEEELTDPIALADESAALLEATGDDDQALAHLGQIEARGSATTPTFLRMAELHRRRDELNAADRAYRAAVELDPRCVEAYQGIAELAALANDYGTAISAYERIVDIQATNAEAWRVLGSFQRQAHRYVESARSLQASLRLSMTPETQLELARTRWAQGDQVAAISYYRSAAANDNEGRMSAEAGWALLESGDIQAAQAMLERAAALRPADGRVLYDLGRCYEIQGAPTRAFEWYMQAAHVAPSPSTLRATGRIARILGERTMARQMLARALYSDRRSGETAAEIGRLHLEEGRADLAARMLRRASRAGVEDVEVQRDLAEALLQLHDPRGALEVLEAIAADDNDLQTKRSRAYELLGNPIAALEIARAAAARQPRNALLQRRVGLLALEANLPAEALVALEAARALGDKEFPTLIGLSRAMLQTGRVTAAIRPIDEAFSRITQGAPDDIRVHVQRGRVLLALENWTEARQAFERALDVKDKAETATTAIRQTASVYPQTYHAALADAWAGLAEAMLRIGGPTSALPYARHALELLPGTSKYLRLIGQLLLLAKDYRTARQVLASDPAVEPATLRLRLQVELADEQWAAAVPLAARCHAVMPNDLQVTAEYGMALLNAGQPNEALPLLETACSSPTAEPGWCATLGRCLLALGNLVAAQDAFNRSLESKPDDAFTHADLAQAQLLAGAPGAAAHSLRQALELGGERLPWRKALAKAYVAQGWYTEALGEWERARRLAPDDISLRLEIASTRLDLGSPEPALQDLEALVAEHADSADAWQLLSRAALACGTPARAVYAAACALSQKPHDASLRVLLAEAALAEGDAQRALDAVSPLVEAQEPNVKALLLVHRAANQLRDPSRARTALERAGNVAPFDPDVRLAIAEHLLSTGEETKALKLLQHLFTNNPKAAPIAAALARLAVRGNALTLAHQAAERAVLLSPQDTNYARLYGEICYAEGDYETARRALQQAMKGRQDANTAMLLGKLAMGRGETAEAQRLLRIAHEQRPGDPEPAGWLALALRKQFEPVHEDEAPEPQTSPALEAAVFLLRQAEKQPSWRLELGWTLMLTGDYENAIKMLLSASRAEELPTPERVKALRRVGVILLALGRAGDAMPPIERAADLDDEDAIVQSLLGQGAEILGDLRRAVEHYSRAALLDPENGRYHLRLGLTLLARGETDASLDHLQRATELQPARAATWVGLSQALAHSRQIERAWQAARRAIQVSPNDGYAWRQVAAVAEEQGDYAAAIDALERALANPPEQGGPQLTKQWLLHFAHMAIMHGKTERARTALQEAADLDPRDADLLHQLAQFYAPNERILLLQRALELLPTKAAWRTELANLLAARGDHRPAIEHLEQAIKDEPRSALHWIALSEAQMQIGDDAAALKTLQRAQEQINDQPELYDASSALLAHQGRWNDALSDASKALAIAPTAERYAQHGRCLQKLRRWIDARTSLESALRLDGTHAQAATYLAEVYLDSEPHDGYKKAIEYADIAAYREDATLASLKVLARAALGVRWDKRIEYAIEHAKALAPNDAELYELQAEYYFYKGKYDLAFAEAEQAIALNPNSARSYHLQAQILRREKRFSEAVTALQAVVRIDGTNKEVLGQLTQFALEALIHGGK